MISYSTNWMGPISMDWFRERGLTETVTHVVQEGSALVDMGRYKVGDTFERDEVVMSYSGGRIDIRGVPNEPWGLEYGLPLMRTEDWNDFGDWLDDFETEELWSLEDILEEYRQDTGHVIRWWKDD